VAIPHDKAAADTADAPVFPFWKRGMDVEIQFLVFLTLTGIKVMDCMPIVPWLSDTSLRNSRMIPPSCVRLNTMPSIGNVAP